MIDVLFLLKDLKYCGFNLQRFVNNRFKDPNKMVIPKTFVKCIETQDGIKYHLNMNLHMLHSVLEYRFFDIRKDDVVLDLGANIGMFAIPASKLSDHVFAVEPIMTSELIGNIKLNNANVTVIDGGFGDGSSATITWSLSECTKTVPTYTLAMLREICGGRIDFLKCDCEAYEWTMKPEDLKGVRRIEMELHYYPKPFPQPNDRLLDYIQQHYDYWIDDQGELKILHATEV